MERIMQRASIKQRSKMRSWLRWVQWFGVTCAVLTYGGGVHAQPDQTRQKRSSAQQSQKDKSQNDQPSPASREDNAEAVRIQHLPQNELETGVAVLRFAAEEPDRVGRILVRYRSGQPGRQPTLRAESGYVARIPADQVQPPGLTYWVVERMPDGAERPVFASAESPHPAHVVHPDDAIHEHEELDARDGKRSRIFLFGEYVDFGTRRIIVELPPMSSQTERTPESRTFKDNYYLLQVGYSYSFFTLVDEIRFDLGRLSGHGASLGEGEEPLAFEPAIYYGQSAITWYLFSGLRLRTALLLGISHEGFEVGGSGDLVLGHPDRTNLSIGFKGVTTLGITGRVRLGFLAAPHFPMGATVEITDFPVGSDFGVRLLYDIGYELSPGTVLAIHGGYQGRTSVLGGFSLGGTVRYAF